MRDIEFVDDNASFASSSCNSSVSLSYRNHGLRRQRTFRRLSRWVSKRTSRQFAYDSRIRQTEPVDDVSDTYAAFCNEFTASGGYYHYRQNMTEEGNVSDDVDSPRTNHSRPDATVPAPADSSAKNHPLPLSDRLFIASPPRSIMDINLEAKHTYAYPSWPRMTQPHAILEEQQQQQQQREQQPPTSHPSSSKPLASGGGGGASFAERMRGRQHQHQHQHPATTTTPVSKTYPTAPAQVFTPALQYLQSSSSSSSSNSNSKAVNQQQQSTPTTPTPRLQRRQSLWKPLKSKFSLVRLRGGA